MSLGARLCFCVDVLGPTISADVSLLGLAVGGFDWSLPIEVG